MAKKHIKILEGHSIKEWESKYRNKIDNGKLKVFNNEKDLVPFAKYWKVNGKYYQVPTTFEWYNKSLRKSPGLTIGLTVTSTLATFFLVAALIQSQIKWNEDQGFTVSFYAGDGTFSDGSKSKVVNGIKKGTKLKEISGYKTKIANLTATDPDYKFGDWVVDGGEKVQVYTDETPITSTVSLKAVFDLRPDDPSSFDEDTWETVFSVIEEGKDAFIDTYCTDSPSYTDNKGDTEDREQALFEFMDSPTNWKIINVGNVGGYGVRLIGLGQDEQAANDPKEVDRAIATFEFNECIMQLPYSFEQGGSPYYTSSGAGNPNPAKYPDPEINFENCALKTYTEDIVQTQLPDFIQRKMLTVMKRTLQIHGGFKYDNNEKLQSWQFDERCLDGSYTYTDGEGNVISLPENKLEIVTTPETLFSLSLDEIGARKIPFNYSDDPSEPGIQLMSETTQENKALIESVITGEKVGEGFYNNETSDYTREYLFYSNEWGDPGEHPSYPTKRMKKYFIGEGDKSVEAQYRLRSIYIPNEFDVDKDGGTDPTKDASGNKDYRPFETWNINTNGDIGHVKKSGPLDPQGTQEWFACSDMAWASIFVAPAFCL